ncbi:hypothetical protein MHB43_20135 [Paenibacillus sp. FSL H8-0317]|uniref:hypothetical protein n=1 Tax=unclassified Paenibacillus TaxID=185978 RepID=UPI0030FA2489
MLKGWLEPAIEKRLWEVVTICEDENKELYDDFNVTLNRLKKYIPLELIDDLNKLEDIFLQKGSSIKTAYRTGFDDGLTLAQELRNTI